jgi:Bacterial SH3 domain
LSDKTEGMRWSVRHNMDWPIADPAGESESRRETGGPRAPSPKQTYVGHRCQLRHGDYRRGGREGALSISHSDVISPQVETNPTVLLKSAENDAAPPLVPTDAPNAVQRPWEEDEPEEISPPFTFEQHRWAGPETSMDLMKRSFGRNAKLITGTAIVVLALGGISYLLFASESSRSSPTQETAATSRSEPSGSIPSITSVPPQDTPSSPTATPPPSSPIERPTTAPLGMIWPEPSAQAPPISWPDPPSRVVQESPRPSPVGSRDRIALSRPTTDSTAIGQPALGTQSPQFAFSQRPGVNVRSTPSLTGSVVGSAPKGTRFEVLENSGEWVQVKSRSLRGWINARFIGPNAP